MIKIIMIERFAARVERFVFSHRFLLAIILLTFLIRLPSLFEPLWYGDEAIYLTIGQKIARGSIMYLEIFDHKTPGIYYLASWTISLLGETIWSFRFLLMTWMLVTLPAFYLLSFKMFGKKIAIAATGLLAILTSIPLLEGNITNSELLMILPTSLGILLGLNKKYLFAGILFSLSFLLKFTGIFDFGVFFIFVAFLVRKNELKETIRALFNLVVGWFIPIILTVFYFAVNGALSAYLNSAFLYNVSYTAYQNSFFISNGILVLKALPVIGVFGYFAYRSFVNFRKRGETGFTYFDFLILWLVFSFYAATFGGRPYEHYLIAVVPAFSLIAAYIFFKRSLMKIGVGILAGAIILSIVLGFRPFFAPNYYFDFFRYVSGNTSFDQYADSFNQQTSKNYALASFVSGCAEYKDEICQKTRSGPDDTIYIYANEPAIYFLSGVAPATRYVTYFHIGANEESKLEAITDLKKKKPKFILVQNSKPGDFSSLENLINSSYNLLGSYENFTIYEFRSSNKI